MKINLQKFKDELPENFRYTTELDNMHDFVINQLMESEDGKRYFYRWHHFLDLCQLAVENYDPALMKRFVGSRKYGKELMTLLYKIVQ